MSTGVTTQERSEPVRTEGKPVTEESFLSDEFVRQLINVGEVDILVGLPTHNNAKTVGGVIQAIQAGLLKAFPRERAAIINPDGGSRDGTPDLVAAASIDDVRRAANVHALRTLHSISTHYPGTAGSAPALRTILAAADLLRAKACVVVSPDSTNMEPDWIARLLQPVYRENADLVSPLYCRNRFDGLLMTNLLYPMTRALYGWRIREPYASEFGFSGRLASQFLGREVWNDEPWHTGPEIFFTLAAVAGGFRLHQAFLGPKILTVRSSADLVPALRQTVGILFSSLDPNFSIWSSKTGSQPVPTTGPEDEFTLESQRVNRKRLRDMFVSGVSELEPVFKSILSPGTLAELQRIAALNEDELRYSSELWVQTVYEFAASYHKSVIARDHIIQALAPLFRGRVFTFVTENRNGSAQDVENNVESLCLEFEKRKPYLLQLWNGGK
jgi:glucosylglycerate synthase